MVLYSVQGNLLERSRYERNKFYDERQWYGVGVSGKDDVLIWNDYYEIDERT